MIMASLDVPLHRAYYYSHVIPLSCTLDHRTTESSAELLAVLVFQSVNTI